MRARRQALHNVEKGSTTHAGLWLDKFLLAQTEDKTDGQQAGPADKARVGKDDPARDAKAELIQEISKLPVPDGYREALRLREALFTEPKERGCVRVQTASARGRLIIGLGQKGPAEVGLALEHTWGVPVLPGSALKGLVAATAHQLLAHPDWHKDSRGKDLSGLGRGGSLAALAGTIEQRGSVVFRDAWWIPAEGDTTLPIHPDVMTVHHPEYYGGGKEAPSDMDSPIPVAFASVSGDFLVVVEKAQPDVPDEHLEAALSILQLGLAQLGIGAKTNAGYGRMELDFVSAEETSRAAARAKAEQAELLRRQEEEEQRRAARQRAVALEDAEGLLRGGLKLHKAAHDVPRLLAGVAGLPPEDVARIAKQALAQLTPKTVREQARSGKQWAVELLKAAE